MTHMRNDRSNFKQTDVDGRRGRGAAPAPGPAHNFFRNILDITHDVSDIYAWMHATYGDRRLVDSAAVQGLLAVP